MPVEQQRAEQYLEKGSRALQDNHYYRADRAFGRAVRLQAELARQVGDTYDRLGDNCDAHHQPALGRYHHKRAKKYYGKLLPLLPAGADRTGVLTQIGRVHHKISNESRGGYSAHHNSRALHYYGHAVQHDAGDPAAHGGRFCALTDRFGQALGRRWYQVGRRYDPAALEDALAELAVLLRKPGDPAETTNRLETATLLFKQPQTQRSRDIIARHLLPAMGAQLALSPSCDAHADAQTACLRALAALIGKQPWCTAAALALVRQFAHAGTVRFDQLEALVSAYEAVLSEQGPLAGVAVTDLAVLHARFIGSPRALTFVLNVCVAFIKAHDRLVDKSVPLRAMAEAARIGCGTADRDVLLYVADILAYAANTYNDMVLPAIVELGNLALAVAAPAHPERSVVRGEVLKTLGALATAPESSVAAAARSTLVQRLGESPDAVAGQALAHDLDVAAPPPALRRPG